MTSPDGNRSWPDHQPEQQREQAQQGDSTMTPRAITITIGASTSRRIQPGWEQ